MFCKARGTLVVVEHEESPQRRLAPARRWRGEGLDSSQRVTCYLSFDYHLLFTAGDNYMEP